MSSLVVGGVQIPEALIAREAQNHPAGEAAKAWAEAAHALAVRSLLLRRARVLGLQPQAEVDEEGREETAEEALIRAVLDAEVQVEPPGEAECRAVYQARPEKFRTPTLYEASHILLEVDPRDADDDERARGMAEDMLAELVRSPGRFADFAREVSACPSAAVGGSLGQLSQGDLVAEMERALDALEPGEIAPAPVRSRFGWHVLRLDRRIAGRILDFGHVAPAIRLNLEARAWMSAATRYVAALADAARRDGIISVPEVDGGAPGPTTLGALLAAGETAGRLESWLAAADPELLTRVRDAALRDGQGLAAWVGEQAKAFVVGADDKAWTQLVSAAQDAEDPALAGLAAILKRKLDPEPRRFTVIQRRP